MTDEIADDSTVTSAPAESEARTEPQYGVGPFSVREVVLAGVWLVAFVVSFFPVNLLTGPQSGILGGANVWVSGLAWIATIGLPTVAVFLLVLRRLSPQGIRRVGSLGVDQFASVAFSVAALVWLTWLWDTVALAIDFGVWVRSWVVWVEVVLLLVGVVLTVFAPLLPVFGQDFRGRPDVAAHRNARPVREISARPVRERPAPEAASAPDEAGYGAGAYAPGPVETATAPDTDAYETHAARPATDTTAGYDADPAGGYDAPAAGAYDTDDTVTSATDVFAPLAENEPADAPVSPADDTVTTVQPATQAFWALVPEERDIVDEYGKPQFRIGPTAWALVIEDRGEVFVVRHEDGRIGYLHDVSGVTRG